MDKLTDKTVDLDLTRIDGNVFNLIGAFSAQAKREKWDKEIIEQIANYCFKASSYDEVVAILVMYCEPKDRDEDMMGDDIYDFDIDEDDEDIDLHDDYL